MRKSGVNWLLDKASSQSDSLADDDHAAAGIASRIETERVIAWLFHGVPGFGDDLVAFGGAGIGGAGVALVPRGRQPGTVDVQPFFTVLHLGLRGRCAPRYCQYSDQYQNSFRNAD